MVSVNTAALTARRSANFYKDVTDGLRAEHKYLPSKYFYDEAGDKLFQRIMACPEYYPSRCELDILQHQSAKMARLFLEETGSFDLVELGPGDASKSWFLLRELQHERADFTYYPIDISSNVIGWLEDKLPVTLPGIRMRGLNGDYLEKMHQLDTFSRNRRIVLFMGANIGNMTVPQATQFCRQLHDHLRAGDLLMIGFDLKKHPRIVLDAYNDRQGITRAFNLNLLNRINRELGGDFNPDQFEHYPVYDPGSGACRSYLISLAQQEVHVGDKTFSFRENEPIYMEISQKYSLEETELMAVQAGFEPVYTFFDSRNWFVDILWQRQP